MGSLAVVERSAVDCGYHLYMSGRAWGLFAYMAFVPKIHVYHFSWTVLKTFFFFIDVIGAATDGAKNYYILCGNDTCSDFTFSGDSSSCNYPPSGCP